jgi:hypothetical protein
MEISNRRALEQVMINFVNFDNVGQWSMRLQALKKFAYGDADTKLDHMDSLLHDLIYTTRLQYSFSNEEMREVAAGLYDRIL